MSESKEKKVSQDIINKVTEQVQREYEEGLQFYNSWMAPKRDNEKYILGIKSSKKVHVRSIFSILQTLYSIFYLDKRKVIFTATLFAGVFIADFLNKLADFDYKRMRKHIYDFLKVYYGFVFGVGILRIAGWDKKKKIPILEIIPSLCAILDPEEIKFQKQRRFIGLNKEITIDEIKKDKRYFNTFNLNIDNKQKRTINIYHHYTKFGDKIYLTSWLDGAKQLIRIEEFNIEKIGEDFGFSIFQPYPMPGQGGADIIDLGAEYQKMLSQIINLFLLQSKKDVLGEDRLVNIKKVDFQDLQTPSVGGKNIPIELGANDKIENVIFPIPKEQSNNKAETGIHILRGLLQESTNMPEIMQGISPGKVSTRGEVQQLQLNANGKFSVISTFLLLSDEEFWLSYQRMYRNYFEGEKNISIKNKYRESFEIITRKDIISTDFIEFNVSVESKIEKEIKNREKFDQMTVLLPMSFPYMGEYQKLVAIREYWEYGNMDLDMIYSKFPLTADEARAREHLILLNADKDIPLPEPGEDHEVYLRVFETGLPTKANQKAIRLRQLMKLRQPKQTGVDNPNMQNMQNIAQAQAGNRLSQQQGQESNIISNENINV